MIHSYLIIMHYMAQLQCNYNYMIYIHDTTSMHMGYAMVVYHTRNKLFDLDNCCAFSLKESTKPDFSPCV